jgi:hypothetical protein
LRRGLLTQLPYTTLQVKKDHGKQVEETPFVGFDVIAWRAVVG